MILEEDEPTKGDKVCMQLILSVQRRLEVKCYEIQRRKRTIQLASERWRRSNIHSRHKAQLKPTLIIISLELAVL